MVNAIIVALVNVAVLSILSTFVAILYFEIRARLRAVDSKIGICASSLVGLISVRNHTGKPH